MSTSPRSLYQLFLRRSVALMSLLTMAAAGGVGGCSVISDLDGDQCQADTDCQGRGPEFANTVCGPEKVCVNAAQVGCVSNQECTDANAGEPFICENVGESCKALLSETCTQVVGDWTNDNAVFIGFMEPFNSELDGLARELLDNTAMGIAEIAKQAGGIPGGPEGSRRPIVLVACEDSIGAMEEVWQASVTHLMDNLKVPAIIGPLTSGLNTTITTDYAKAKDVLMMCPTCTSPALTDLDDDNLFWRTAPSAAWAALGHGKYLAHAEDEFRTRLDLQPADPLRVALLVKGTSNQKAISEVLLTEVAFNGGKSAAENDSDGNFLRLDYPDDELMEVDYTTYVAQIVAFKPHVILTNCNTELATIIEFIEGSWPDPDPRPLYLDSGALFADPQIAGLASMDPDVRARFRGVKNALPVDRTAYDSYILRYKATFPQKDINELTTDLQAAYDAGYAIAYGVVGAGSVPTLTGNDIAKGLSRLSDADAPKVYVGPTDLNKGFGALEAGGNINIHGVQSTLDFDPATGEPPADVGVWCFVVGDDGMATFEETDLVYNSETAAFETSGDGTSVCE